MSFAPETEQRAYVEAHPGLYKKVAGPARLIIRGGRLDLGSLDRPGFAVSAEPDFAAMSPMPPAPQRPVGSVSAGPPQASSA
jgi:hypothetical protein